MSRHRSGAEAMGRFLAFAADSRWGCASGHTTPKASRQAFESGVDSCREWPAAGLLVGECPRCHSTIAFDLLPGIGEEQAA